MKYLAYALQGIIGEIMEKLKAVEAVMKEMDEERSELAASKEELNGQLDAARRCGKCQSCIRRIF